MNLISMKFKNRLRIKKKKAKQKAAVEPPTRAALTFVQVVVVDDLPTSRLELRSCQTVTARRAWPFHWQYQRLLVLT
jgi:hypothetical protein